MTPKKLRESELFRREVYESARSNAKADGVPLLIMPLSFTIGAICVVLVFLSTGCLLYWGSYTNKESVAGYVTTTNGLVTVYGSKAGIVSARYVHFGEKVSKGDKLYKISMERSTGDIQNVDEVLLEQLQEQLKDLKLQQELVKQQASVQIEGLVTKLSNINAELNATTSRAKTEVAILKLQKTAGHRYATLFKKKMIPRTVLDAAVEKTLSQSALVGQINETILGLKASRSDAEIAIKNAEINTRLQIAEYSSKIDQMQEQILEFRVDQDTIVQAPTAGVISAVLARNGQNVDTGTPLISILPEKSLLEVRLLVPAQAIGFIHKDQTVHLRYSAFPYQQFGLYEGRVKEVSQSIVTPNELKLPVSMQVPYYLVTVALSSPYVNVYGTRIKLTPGMTLQADIAISRERLYEWVLRPLVSLRGQ
jgi:membrane fusion protein